MILDGKSIAAKRLEELRIKIQELRVQPKLVVVVVGDDSASKMYVSMKAKRAREVGMLDETVELPESIGIQDLRFKIQELNSDPTVTGILIQLPFPTDELRSKQREILDSIDPLKDVDGLTSQNMGLLALGKPRFLPATVKGILSLIFSVIPANEMSPEPGSTDSGQAPIQSEQARMTKWDKYMLAGKEVVVVGRSDIDGKPLAISLIALGATVTVCNSKTLNLSDQTKRADILITAVGKPNLITADMVKEGAVVIDAGINKTTDYRSRTTEKKSAMDGSRLTVVSVVGDVDFDNVKNKVSWITPVPGSVGPMTVVSLLENTFAAFQLQSK
jgi:methylenetetrahydrofolate dehydrogenase (NADP+)/methenyltetrahydrofolate cyclohydrolase